jgi:hypothetical protein
MIQADSSAAQVLTAVDYQAVPSLPVFTPLASYQNISLNAGAWGAGVPNPLAKLLPLGATGTAQIKLEFLNLSGTDTIGDVWVDPWARR